MIKLLLARKSKQLITKSSKTKLNVIDTQTAKISDLLSENVVKYQFLTG